MLLSRFLEALPVPVQKLLQGVRIGSEARHESPAYEVAVCCRQDCRRGEGTQKELVTASQSICNSMTYPCTRLEKGAATPLASLVYWEGVQDICH